MHRTAHHTLHALSSALAELNLTAAEINALANLADRGALSVRELSAETGTRATTLTGVLDRLESRGYLTRELDPTDRRSFRLPLTEAGREVAERVRKAVADLERDTLSRLSATQIAGFNAVIAALQAADLCPAISRPPDRTRSRTSVVNPGVHLALTRSTPGFTR